MKIIASKDFTSNLGEFIKGDELKGLTYEQIVKLNEQGFIEPLQYKDLVLIKRELQELKKEENHNVWESRKN